MQTGRAGAIDILSVTGLRTAQLSLVASLGDATVPAALSGMNLRANCQEAPIA